VVDEPVVDEPVVDEPAPASSGRSLAAVVRYLLGAVLGVVVLLLLAGKRGELAAAWRQLGQVSAAWLVAAAAAQALSLLAFAYLQRRVLHYSGTRVPMGGLTILTLANNAIASTVPGEPAVSSAYRYRYYRRWGASGASAGWTVFTILVAQAIGMSLLLLLGVLVALLGSTSAGAAGAAVAGLVIVAAAGAVLVRRDLILRLAGAGVRLARRVTGHPRGTAGARIETTLAQMRDIGFRRRSAAWVVVIATGVWLADFGCLLCAFGAVHAPVPWSGVLLAYGVAQIAATLPVVPGGIGIVEGSLAVILAAYGAGRVPALSAALAYRLVSFWLAIAVGWLSAGLLARRAGRASTIADGSPGGAGTLTRQADPRHPG
jgi:uncharacterized protein (TIRG00374 family)